MPSTVIYTLSLHDALPISTRVAHRETLASHSAEITFTGNRAVKNGIADDDVGLRRHRAIGERIDHDAAAGQTLSDVVVSLANEDRKSTRLNSSHGYISYAVHRDLHSFPTRRSSDLNQSCAPRNARQPLRGNNIHR